jgi:hypothetical protein
MRQLSIAVLAVFIAALAACSSNSAADLNAPPPSGTTSQQEVGKAVLKIGESIAINDLRLTFRSVEGDSRCPTDAVCVWAGDAEIALKIEQGTQAAVAALHTTLEPKKTVWNGYTISLVTVSPTRKSTTSVDPADYRAEVVVTR